MSYKASDIEVLTGLEPVRKRPGMYTDTTRPNHLVQEVLDNSVDEALGGHANNIVLELNADGSIAISDDGRGMPVDLHHKLKKPGVEVILSTLHAGGKFSNKNYQFAGGLHGVGVSVVNALSSKLVVTIFRDGFEHKIEFAGGKLTSPLATIGSCAARKTGTKVEFTPDSSYFETLEIAKEHLKHTLKAKAVLCNGLKIKFIDHKLQQEINWHYEHGLCHYLLESNNTDKALPIDGYHFEHKTEDFELAVALRWLEDEGNCIEESYVNLIPTIQGGTHLNGFRTGLLEAVKEYCELRNLLAKNIKLSTDDIWQKISYIISCKLADAQFSGQTKERLTSRQVASMVQSITKDNFSLWLNNNTDEANAIAERVIENAQNRLRKSKVVARKKIASGPALPGKLSDCTSKDLEQTELFIVEGDSAGGSAKQARDKEFQAILPLRGKF